MIVLVIASVLAAIAYPSYREHLIRGALPQATGGLSLYAMRLEEYFQDRRSYRNADEACGVAPPMTQAFNFSCVPGDGGNSFLITATGRTGDLAAFSFTLDHLGNQRTIALPQSWGRAPADCWVQRRGPC